MQGKENHACILECCLCCLRAVARLEALAFELSSHAWTLAPAACKQQQAFPHVLLCTFLGLLLAGGACLADYSSSKFAAAGFAESLRYELQRMGCRGVSSLLVHPYATK
jgi:hypothetical protein